MHVKVFGPQNFFSQKPLLVAKPVVTSSWRSRYQVVTSKLGRSLLNNKKSLPSVLGNGLVTASVTTCVRSWLVSENLPGNDGNDLCFFPVRARLGANYGRSFGGVFPWQIHQS